MQDQPTLSGSINAGPSLSEPISAGLYRATSADAAAVRDLVRAAYSQWVPRLGREPKPMTADYDAAVRDHVVDVLRVDGQMAALIEMKPMADHLLVVNVAVLAYHQGQGYGRALLTHAEEFASSLDSVDIQSSGLIKAPFRGALDVVGSADVEGPAVGADATASAGQAE